MNAKTLAKILKLRQYQLELEEWKLYQKQIEEQKALDQVREGEKNIQKGYGDGSMPKNAADAIRRHHYLEVAAADLKVCERKHSLTQKSTAEQLDKTLKSQQRKEMIGRLKEHAVGVERKEFDVRERKLLDDIAQARFLRQEKAVLR